MTSDKNRYFIAIIPPSPLYEQALELKHYFRDHHQTKAALNSPPHITLHMPFEWKSQKEVQLVEQLDKFSSGMAPATIELKNFDCFSPRTIFIGTIPSPELLALQRTLQKFCKMELGLFNADYRDLPFHPHLTVAFRDLKKQVFAKAWAEFKDKQFEGKFVADQISLLKHDGKKWYVLKSFPLNSAE